MAFDASGIFTRLRGNTSWTGDRDAGTKIMAGLHDDNDNDLANGLTECITKTGKSLPTVDIPWNGKKILNLGAGVNPTDAINKGQLDALRNFSSAISITGSTPESRLKFTGTTGPWGDSYVTADLSFGASTSGQWVWNNKADFSGTSVMTLDPALTTTLTINSVDGGAGSGPWLRIHRSSPSPAALDIIGAIAFMGRTSAAANIEYAGMWATILDPTTSTMDGSLTFRTMMAGTQTEQMTMSDGVLINRSLTVNGNTVVGGTVTGNVVETANVQMSGYAFGGKVLNNYVQFFGGKGDTTPNLGANIVMYGPSVGASSNVMEFRQGGTTRGSILTGGTWTFNTAVTMNSNLEVGGVVDTSYYKAQSSTGLIIYGFVDVGTSKYNQILSSQSIYPSPLYLQEVYVPGQYVDCRIVMPDVGAGPKTFAFRSDGQAFKAVAGDWAAYSDARIKDVLGDYTDGLAAIRQLKPKRYKLKGNDQPPPLDGETTDAVENNEPPMVRDPAEVIHIGLIAQDVEVAMPYTVTQVPGYIDGEWIEDKRMLDPTAITYALVNSIIELADRLEALEGAAAA